MFKNLEKMKNRNRKTKITFTFDDGKISVFKNAFPILKEFGLTGCLAVVVDFIGEKDTCFSWNQLQEMVDAGWAVVSHTCNHNLTNLTPQKIWHEVVESKEILNAKGFPSDIFIMPGGPWQHEQPEKIGPESEFLQTVREHYRAYMVGSSNSVIKLPLDPPYEFPRFGCECYNMEQFNPPLAKIKNTIDQAVSKGDWCHLGWHDISGQHIKTFTETVAHVMTYVNAGMMEPATISEVLDITE